MCFPGLVRGVGVEEKEEPLCGLDGISSHFPVQCVPEWLLFRPLLHKKGG